MTPPDDPRSPRRPGLDFPPKDEPLRDDVRTLGDLVGRVIREQGGDDLFAAVEAARKAAIARREEPARVSAPRDGEARLVGLVEDLPPGEAELLVRAFATYFQVVNMAEKAHRIRRRRDYLRRSAEDGEPQRYSLRDTVGRLAAAGLGPDEAAALFTGLRVEPVFTAHPTEATRRTLLEKQQEIARRLVDLMNPALTPQEEQGALERIRAEVTATWQTEEQPRQRPRVEDEAEHVLFYVTDVLYRVMPPFYEDLAAALEAEYGTLASAPDLPRMFAFASWVGGDMDGNPNVGADTLRRTLARQRKLVLGLYRREVAQLSRRLSQSRSRIGVDAEVEARIDDYRQLFPETYDAILPRHREMPYRVLLRLVEARLEATLADRDAGYGDAGELTADLAAVAASLEAHRGEHAGLFAVRRALRRVDTFGFHLATLDVRQDALVHRRAVGRMLGEEGWEERSPSERAERLRRALEDGEEPAWRPGREEGDGAGDGTGNDGSEDPAADARRTLEVMEAIAEGRRRFGERAVGPYIMSMAKDRDDVFTTLLLARWGGLVDDDGSVPLDVVPLFETVPDLEAAPAVMAGLLGDDLYRRHLASRGDRQMVMVGYSDSSKDGGMAASRWGLQKAQAALVDTFADAAEASGTAIALTIFHGRGGTVSRGGGSTHRAVMAAPEGAVAGRLRLTEQGEVIDDKYGLRGIALRTLERTWGATALATALDRPGDPREERWRRIMGEIAGVSRRVYRGLVYDEPDFPAFFRGATPIDVISRMNIGSRPSSRRAGEGIGDLRAIPWVFAWTQSRLILPGWYGLGSGLEAAVEAHGEDEVEAMVADWPFFANLVDDAEMVLAKADLPIAERYVELAGKVGETLFPRVRREMRRTVDLVLRLKGNGALLDGNPTLQRSIRLRNPYVDPMSLLQVDLLRRWRAGGRQDDALLAALLATVQGIAHGLQNTG